MPLRLALLASLALIAPAAAVRAADLDPHLPPDTERYVAVNLEAILSSQIGKKIGKENLRSLFENLEQVNALLKELNIDPLTDVKRVQIASPNSTEADRGLMILTGKFDAAKLKKKADDSVNDTEPTVKAHKAPLGNK